MKIKTLYIKSFANIQEETFDFGNSEGLTLLIGNNGSGKSSLLECISGIQTLLTCTDPEDLAGAHSDAVLRVRPGSIAPEE